MTRFIRRTLYALGVGALLASTALAAAPERGWTVIDMKTDWKTIFTVSQ